MKPFVCSSLIILTAFVSVSSATNTVDTSKTWKLLQKRAAQSQKSQEPQLVGLAVDSKNTESNKTGGAKSTDTSPRQYGHYHSSGYGGGSGSYDIYTLLAVSAFAALFGALFFQLATGSSKHKCYLSLQPRIHETQIVLVYFSIQIHERRFQLSV